MTILSGASPSPAGPSPAGPWAAAGPLRMTPGRWLALAIGVPVALALIGWAGFGLVASVARGSYPFSFGVPVQQGQVALNVNQGNITLHPGAATSSARLTGTVQYGLSRPGISEWGGPGGFTVGLNCAGVSTGNCGMNASLDVPPRTGVMLNSNGGDISASGFASGTQLTAEGGNITASNLSGNVYLDSGGGDVNAEGLTGTLHADAEGGNITASNWTTTGTMRADTGGGDFSGEGLTGDLQLSTMGGNVLAYGVTSAVTSVQSGGGDVSLTFSQAPQNLQITAQGGNVIINLPPGSTTYNIYTPDTQGGNVSFPSSLASASSHNTITIDSGGGDIIIDQS